MKESEKFNLKLIGKNQEDLKVLSAYLQDSVVTIKDIVLKLNGIDRFTTKESRMFNLVNNYQHEKNLVIPNN